MLKDLLNYGSMTTKVRAMSGRLLKKKSWYDIISIQSVAEFCTFLKNTPSYEDAFSGVNEYDIHRGQIEKLLWLSLYGDYAKIYTFAKPSQRAFLKIYFKRYEIQIIKTFLRQIFDHRDITYDTRLIPERFKSQSDINLDTAAHAKTLDDFFEAISGSDYYRILNVLRDTGTKSLFDYELALDIYFFKYVWKLKDKTLQKKEQRAMTKVFGCQIDMLNMIWIYRSKKYYHVDNGTIYSNLIPITNKLNPQFLSKLIELETAEDVLSALAASPYHKAFTDLDAASDNAIEQVFSKLMLDIQKSAADKYPYSFAIINYYLYAKEDEINKLTTALECIRYSLDSTEIANYIAL